MAESKKATIDYIIELKSDIASLKQMMESHVKQSEEHLKIVKSNTSRIDLLEKSHAKAFAFIAGIGTVTGGIGATFVKFFNGG